MTEKQLRKHKLWIDIAHRISQESKDRSTQVGCVLVSPEGTLISSGWNGFPKGVNDENDDRHERPQKYEWTVHAEANAVANAALKGISTHQATAYLNWEPSPCGRCMGLLRNAGITCIVGPNRLFAGKGLGTAYTLDTVTKDIVDETSIEIVMIEYEGPWK